VLLFCSAGLVSAHRSNHSELHPDVKEGVIGDHGMTPEETEALYTKIWAELEARNYSNPAPEDVNGGGHGLDISQFASTKTWSCFRKNGKSWTVVRQYQSNCRVDPNGVHSVANGWAAKFAHIDIYLFPSYGCGYHAASQVDQAIDGMGKVPFGKLWFDIESSGSGWSPTKQNNVDWLHKGIARAVQRLGHNRVGIYSSANGWSVAMGSNSGFTGFPIWYAHYDNNPSFSDWRSFGGWAHPVAKQYSGTGSLCGLGVDLNYFP